MSMVQLLLPVSGDASDAIRDRERLRATRNESISAKRRTMAGKRLQVLNVIQMRGDLGLTMREMAAIAGKSINCWTQPFADLRDWGVIETTNERRDGGVVHRAKRTIVVQPNGDWE